VTTGVIPSPYTARAILFPQTEAQQALSHELDNSGVAAEALRSVKHLSDAGQREVLRRLTDVTSEILGVDAVDLVVRTLWTYDDLVVAARRTIAAPASVEIVQLLTIPIPWVTRAEVQLRVNDVARFRICFEIKLVLEINAEAVIRNGWLIALRSGQCGVTVTLTVNDGPLMTNATRFDLDVALQLGHGIPLTQQPPPWHAPTRTPLQ
jgi:hypothetical protein